MGEVGLVNPGTPWAIYTTGPCSALATCGVSFSVILAVQEARNEGADKGEYERERKKESDVFVQRKLQFCRIGGIQQSKRGALSEVGSDMCK